MAILYTALVAVILAFALGFLLGFFKKVFAVKVDPLQEKIRSVLPGSNCGACGYPGCDGFASAAAEGIAPADGCTAGGADTAEAVGKALGVSVSVDKKFVVLACQGTKHIAQQKGDYIGVKTCRAVKLAVNGVKVCQWGCIGFGDCVAVCKFDALQIGEDGLPHVDYVNCTGCGMCAKECPQMLFVRISAAQKGAVPLCSNRSQQKASIVKFCKTGCIKCGKCERVCPQKAIVVTYGIPVVDYAKCNSCGECVKGCPTKVLKLLETDVFPAK